MTRELSRQPAACHKLVLGISDRHLGEDMSMTAAVRSDVVDVRKRKACRVGAPQCTIDDSGSAQET